MNSDCENEEEEEGEWRQHRGAATGENEDDFGDLDGEDDGDLDGEDDDDLDDEDDDDLGGDNDGGGDDDDVGGDADDHDDGNETCFPICSLLDQCLVPLPSCEVNV